MNLTSKFSKDKCFLKHARSTICIFLKGGVVCESGGGRWGVGGGSEYIILLLDLEVFVGRVLVAIDLHVGHVSLFRSGSDCAGLFNLKML